MPLELRGYSDLLQHISHKHSIYCLNFLKKRQNLKAETLFYTKSNLLCLVCQCVAGFSVEFLTLSENDRRLSLVSRPWQRPSLNLFYCTTQDHWLGATITEIATFVSQCHSFIWNSWKSYSVLSGTALYKQVHGKETKMTVMYRAKSNKRH